MWGRGDAASMKTWALGALLLSLTGCGKLVMKIDSMSLPGTNADVLWLQRGGEVYRCYQRPSGVPVCAHAPFADLQDPSEAAPPPVSVTPIQPEGK